MFRAGLSIGSRPHEALPPSRYAPRTLPSLYMTRETGQRTKYPVRELGRAARALYPRQGGGKKVTDEVTSQRYLVLAALKAPQNLPQYDLASCPSICYHI